MAKKNEDYNETIESLVTVIENKTNCYLKNNFTKITELYGTENPTINNILSRFYGGAPDPIDSALLITTLLYDLKRMHILPVPLILYNLGVCYTYFNIGMGNIDMPIYLKNMYHKEISSKYIKKKWDAVDQCIEKLKNDAKKRWIKWNNEGGEKIYHNKMADILLAENPKAIDAGVTKGRLLRTLKEVAHDIDPSLVRGIKTKKN
jgi:hypothetical protein